MSFSPKQKQILTFPYESDYDALICDGAVRSGKTSIMSLSFVLWMMAEFNHCSFAFCGKSVGAVERNIVQPLLSVRYLQQQFQITYNRSGHVLTVQRGSKVNMVYLFGGKDESSYMLIQGITLAGGASGRGGAHAPQLCGAGAGPMLCHRCQVLVQLQPGKP